MTTHNTQYNTYKTSFTVGGKRFRKTFKTKLEADKYELDVRTKSFLGVDYDDVTKNIEEVCYEVYEERWANTSNDQGRLGHIRCIISFFGFNTSIKDINKHRCNDYVYFLKNTKRNSVSTINGKISALSVILDYAYDQDYIDSLPKVKGRKKPNNECLEYISEEEESIILPFMLEHRSDEMRTYGEFWAWSVDTGFRPSESRRLRPQDVYKDDSGHWVARLLKSKTNTWRVIPLTDRALEMWQKNRSWAHITPTLIARCWELVRKYRGRQNDPTYKPYLTRHTTGSRLVQRNVDLPVIKQLLGHSDLTSTMRYAKVSPTNLITAINKLNKTHINQCH
jgi:integrase